MEQELLFLGLLKDGPKHGYEIKKRLKEILSLFTGLQLTSIYYPLKVLAKKGLVSEKIILTKKRPQRIVYSLTEKGEKKFEQLLEESLLEIRRPQFNLDLSLYFLKYLPNSVVCLRLKARRRLLSRILFSMLNMLKSQQKDKNSYLYLILEHNIKLLQTELDFLSSFIKNYKNKKLPKES